MTPREKMLNVSKLEKTSIQSAEDAKRIYYTNVEEIKESHGYSITVSRARSGWTVFKWYSRNNWVDDVLERKILLRNDGSIFENKIKIGEF